MRRSRGALALTLTLSATLLVSAGCRAGSSARDQALRDPVPLSLAGPMATGQSGMGTPDAAPPPTVRSQGVPPAPMRPATQRPATWPGNRPPPPPGISRAPLPPAERPRLPAAPRASAVPNVPTLAESWSTPAASTGPCGPVAAAMDPCALPACATCRPRGYAGAGASILPNIGVSVHGGWVFLQTDTIDWSVEAEGIWQFIDDETFIDDGNPEAGDWYQGKLGVKARFSPAERRHLTLRGGFTLFEANGAPNIVQFPGTYYGIYGGIGLETDLTPNITMGPELLLTVATRDGSGGSLTHGFIPQIAWRVTWWIDGCNRCATERLPLGEVYAGIHAAVSPGFGGGFELGQVFARSSVATWSVELSATFQDVGDSLFGEEDGSFGVLRGGAKAVFDPCACSHWVARAGPIWFRNTGDITFVDEPHDYFGLFASVGYEWDLGQRFTTGPEFLLAAASQEGDFEVEWLPMLSWHFIVKL